MMEFSKIHEVVRVYEVTLYKSYAMYEQGTSFSLKPWSGDDAYYGGYDDGGKNYKLPEGYRLGETIYGEPAIYDDRNRYCELTKWHGRPAFITDKGYLALNIA